MRLGVGEVEIVSAVHEHEVVTEQIGVGDVDQLGGGANLQLELALGGGAEQVEERAGGVVAAAAVAELGDFDDAAGVPSAEASSPRRRVEALFFAFGFAIGGVGEDVDADGEGVGDVFDDGGRVAIPLAGAGELPVAGQILVAVDDARAAAVFDAVQSWPAYGESGRTMSCIRQIGMAGRDRLQFVLGLRERRRPSAGGSRHRSALESLQQASAKMKPPRST